MSRRHDDQADYEAFALESKLDRDTEHEPTRPGWTRRAARSVTATVDLACPACSGHVYAPADSHAERLACYHCAACLVTRRALDGSVSVELDDATTGRLHEALLEVGSRRLPALRIVRGGR